MWHRGICIGVGLALTTAAGVEAQALPDRELMGWVVSQQDEAALARVEQWLAGSASAAADDRGQRYLRARLLTRLGRHAEAAGAYAEALTGLEVLRPHARLGLAGTQLNLGHPEVAAGLAVSLLANPGNRQLEADALRVLRAGLAAGGDCRLIEGLEPSDLGRAELGRALAVTRADCAARAGQLESARDELLSVMSQKLEDEPALEAALRVAALTGLSEAQQLTVARAVHHHRLFPETLAELELVLPSLPASVSRRDDVDALYLAARSQFWLEDWPRAILAFGELSRRATSPRERARALYQQGRTEELAGHPEAAYLSFARTVDIDPRGAWSAAALTGAMRIEWLAGRRERALAILAKLGSEGRSRDPWIRGRLFVAASLIEEGDGSQGMAMLEGLDRGEVEVAYWRFRAEAAQGRDAAAIDALLPAARRDPFGPFAQDAAGRIGGSPSLRASAVRRAERDFAGDSLDDLAVAAYVFEALGDPRRGAAVAARSRELLAAKPTTRAMAELQPPAVENWPIDRWPMNDSHDALLALGLWDEVPGKRLLERFPPTEPALVVAASRLLVASRNPREGVRLAEIVVSRLTGRFPTILLPPAVVEVLYPQPWLLVVRSETARRGVEPALLYGIVREESRFDPRALSESSARGLTQFVLPTARRLLPQLGLDRLQADDLYRPELALGFGAAYLAELHAELPAVVEQETHVVVAAYNAGEAQARLWRSYCSSTSPTEFMTKVGFEQTRGYLTRVLRSRAIYQRDPQLRGHRRVAGDPPAGARPTGR